MMRKILIEILAAAFAAFGAAEAVAKDCSELYILRSPSVFASYNSVVAEVLIKFDEDSKYRVAGIVFNGDWGVMNVCVPKFSIRLRWLLNANSSVGERKDDDRGELKIDRMGRKKIFVEIARKFVELDEYRGIEQIRKIEEEVAGRGYPLAKWEFRTDRYGLICPRCSQFRPEDFMSEDAR